MEDPEAGTIAAQIIFLLCLTLVNAFFAGAEMAVVSVNKNRMRRLSEEGNKKAALICRLSEDSTRFLSTIQVAITFAGFFSSASAATGISQVLAVQMEKVSIPYSQTIAVVIVTIILSYFTLVFGELVPKRIALCKAEAFSLICVQPIYGISKILSPFIKLLSLSTNGFLKLLGMNTRGLEEVVSEEEIKALLETGEEKGVFNQIEKDMITSIFSFDDKKAKEVMTPRQDMVTIHLDDPAEAYLDEVLNSRYSRIPVYEGNIDNIVGILSMKDYSIEARKTSFGQVDIRRLMKPPYFIPENRMIDDLFKEMQRGKIPMAVLIDEYGGVSGLVTIEDLIEEIVGDIQNEYDNEEPDIVKEPDGSYLVTGGCLLWDLREKLHLKLVSECDTLSGYLIECLGYIPKKSQLPVSWKEGNTEFTIIETEDKVIKKVKIELTV